METQNTPVITASSIPEFETGSVVIYGAHGKCTVTSIEEKQIGNDTVALYKLEIHKSPLSRSQKKDPAIWVPVISAKERGMRPLITTQQADAVKQILASREYYFSLNKPWNEVHPELELKIRLEGCSGLAKVASYLFVLNRKSPVPNSEAIKMQESVNKLLYKELGEALNQLPKELEQQMQKPLRQKLLPSN